MHAITFSFIEAYLVASFYSASGAFAFKVRRCWGHRMAGFRSELTYSSDEMFRLQAKLYLRAF